MTNPNPLIPVEIDRQSFEKISTQIELLGEALNESENSARDSDTRRNIGFAKRYFEKLKKTFDRVKENNRQADRRLAAATN